MKRTGVGVGVALLAVGVGGCVRRNVTPPPEASVTLGGKTAPYRAWATVSDLCAIDAQQFRAEQDAMTALLAEWLGQTSATVDGAWDDEHLALLEAGAAQLPPALAVQQAALRKTETVGCTFEGLGPAKELNGQALRRVASAEQLVPQIKARLALAKWKTERPQAASAARQQQCAPKPKTRGKAKAEPPQVYFAAEDEAARLEWLFCDGSMVFATPGNEPAWEPAPVAKKPKKPVDPTRWLEAAAGFPAEQVSRAPRLPRKVIKRAEDTPEPGDEP